MKKVIIILAIILASISCEKEKCKECSTLFYYADSGAFFVEGTYCGEQLEKTENRCTVGTNPVTGEITVIIMTKCK
jgi:hypothetical protein